MSYITKISGWIEVNDFSIDHNRIALKSFRFVIIPDNTNGHSFVDMFAIPKYTGRKNPGYFCFGGSFNYLNFDVWKNSFEELFSKLHAWRAFVMVDLNSDYMSVFRYSKLNDEDMQFTTKIIEQGQDYGCL
jgi:hypothetical protein